MTVDTADTDGLWEAMRALACAFHLEDRAEGGMLLDPAYGEELAHATLQFNEDGLLWLGLRDGRVLVEPVEGTGLC